MGTLIIITGAVVIVMAVSYARFVEAQRRRRARMALAEKLGLQFDHQQDRDLAKRYSFLNRLQTGDNHYAFNTFWGNYQGHDVRLFDYHYELHALESKSRNPEHHYFSCFVLHLPRFVPELTIAREGLVSKIAQAFGYEDIDFESHRFSRKFCVRSPDKKFAYDVCNARMIEYLLANDDLTIEIDQDALAITSEYRVDLEDIEPNLNRLVTLRSLMPEYLFSGSTTR